MLAKTEVPCGVVLEKILHLHGCGEKAFRVRELFLAGGRRQVCVGVTEDLGSPCLVLVNHGGYGALCAQMLAEHFEARPPSRQRCNPGSSDC
jgi:hypothetical protein